MSRTREGDEGRSVSFQCRGHHHLRATHSKTLELTRESEISERATCVVGVCADYDPAELARLKGPLEVRLELDPPEGEGEVFSALANPFMKASESLVFRRSRERFGNTFAIQADKGSRDLGRQFIAALQHPESILKVEIRERPSPPGAELGALLLLPLAPAEALSREVLQTLPALDAIASPEPKVLRAWRWPVVGEVLPCRQSRDVDLLMTRLEQGQRLGLALRPSDLGADTPCLDAVAAALALGSPLTALGSPYPPQRALLASGLPAHPALFLPLHLGKQEFDRALEELGQQQLTLVWPPSRGHLRAGLKRLHDLLGERQVTLARNPGGLGETFLRGSPLQVLEKLEPEEARSGETVVIVSPPSGQAPRTAGRWPSTVTLEPLLTALVEQGIPLRPLSKSVAQATSLSQKEAYRRLLTLRDEPELLGGRDE